jgi:thiamine biosynthesis lipoprotein
MAAPLNRRRVIGISAAAAGLALLPIGGKVQADELAVTWRGQALGAVASLVIHHRDRALALGLVENVAAEVRRLERIFSLYNDDSDLTSLNRYQAIVSPPVELVGLLQECDRFWRLTGGAFDPTVQPLWIAYRTHFATSGADPAGPPPSWIGDAMDRVGFDKVLVSPDRIGYLRPGMAITLNGIAQGYITDRIVDLLRAGADGTGWQVGLENPNAPGKFLDILKIMDRAVATSSRHGFRFDAEGRFNHLLDPRNGHPSQLYESVTVVASNATMADALSTAFSLMETEAIRDVVGTVRQLDVHLAPVAGEPVVLRS